jgi:hypothetical protein
MVRIFTLIALAIIYAAPAAAQSPAFTQDYTLESTLYGAKILPLGNTLNDNFIVFYDHYSGGKSALKTCIVQSNGGPLGAKHVIAPDINIGNYSPWDVVWHPTAKCFMAVFRVNGALYARKVGVDGIGKGTAKKITDYDGQYLVITWAMKNKFVVFFQRDDQVAGQALRKTARKFRGEKSLVSLVTGISYPLDADTEEDGTAVAYYARYWASPGEADPSVLRVNHKLQVLDNYDVVSDVPATSEYQARYIRGAYDPVDKVHTIAYRIGAVPAKYMTFKKDSTWIKKPTNLPANEQPRYMLYDHVNQRFAVFFYTLNYFEGRDHSEFRLSIYRPNGTIVVANQLLKQTDNENDAHGCGFNKVGHIFVGWVNDGGPPGILGRLLY